MRPPFVLYVAGLAILLNVVHADRNVTVDDNDASIRYSSGWSLSNAQNSFNFGGFHHLTDQTTATATFTFTGTAIYFKSPRWPYPVGANLKVDDSATDLVDLQDYQGKDVNGAETINTSDVWGRTGLKNGQHTLTVSFATGKQYLVLDALVYTVPDATTSGGPSTTSSSSTGKSSADSLQTGSPSKTDDSSSQSTSKILPIALGVSLGIVSLILVIVAFFLIRRRRKNKYPSSFTGNSMISAFPPASIAGVDNSMGSRVTSSYAVEPWNNPYGSAAPPSAPATPAWNYGAPYSQHPHPYGAATSHYGDNSSLASGISQAGARPYASYYNATKEPVRMSYADDNAVSEYGSSLPYNSVGQYQPIPTQAPGSSAALPYAQSPGFASSPPIQTPSGPVRAVDMDDDLPPVYGS